MAGYTDLGRLGIGGMGEVRRVRQEGLDRVLALKAIHRGLDVGRFLAEARVTARLQHPGIVPVHEIGTLPDGRPYFTMQEIRGQSFFGVARGVHAASKEGWAPGADGWTLHRLVEAFARVCDTLAYAHAQGVVHRDLKPDNIMVGEFGEILVVDWGLALELGRPAHDDPDGPLIEPESALQTVPGSMAGTPSYMAPEQAVGTRADVGAFTDVWALGAVLYEILAGEPPFGSDQPIAVLHRMLTQAPRPFPAVPPPPEELTVIARRALSRAPGDRYAHAGEMAAAVHAWLDGADRRRKALAAVEAADAHLDRIGMLRERAVTCREDAARLLEGIPSWQGAALKQPGWAKEEEASALELDAGLLEVAWISEIHGALQHDPTLGEAHQRLADHYREQHVAAERRRDALSAAANLSLLRQHDRGKHSRYLRGTGALTLLTDPPGATVSCARVVERGRRLVEDAAVPLGVTPLEFVELPVGSYMLTITADGYDPVRMPMAIERDQHFVALAPDDVEARVLRLPLPGELGPDDIFVPAGWFWCGGDPNATDSFPSTRIWVEDVIFRRFPVTVGEYAEWLRHLLATEGPEAVVARSPAPSGESRTRGVFAVVDGSLVQREDHIGQHWDPRIPLTTIDWYDATAFAAWEAHRSGLLWRLPHELEWEKAARGVDRRLFPWGDHPEASWAANVHAFEGPPLSSMVDSFPLDRSPYGVRGCAGNVRDLCNNIWTRQPEFPPAVAEVIEPHRDHFLACRGGSSGNTVRALHLATRYGGRPFQRHTNVGFRLARHRTPSQEHP